MKKLIIFYLIFFAPLLGFAQYETDEVVEKPLNQEQKESLHKLVEFDQGFEFEARGEPLFYSPTILYKYINGAADLYLQHDFVGLIHQEFVKDQAEVIVDIYGMGNVRNAFGIYAAERSPDYQFLDIGTQGYLDMFSLNFWKGQYYVKLSAFADDDEQTAELLKSMANAISENIAAKSTWPEMVNAFPKDGLVENSVSLVTKSPLGFDYLSPAWVATYEWGGHESTLYISEAESNKDAQQRMEKLVEFIEKTGEIEKQDSGYRGKNDYQGELYMQVVQDWMVILINPNQDGYELINDLSN